MSPDVAVIGAGVSGLAVAEELAARGCDVQVLERHATIGGKACSQRFGSFLMEHGPTTMNAAQRGAMERLATLGLTDCAIDLGAGVRRRYLRDGGALHAITLHRAGFLLSPYLSLRGRLSLLAEVLRPPRRDAGEESVQAFITRRFGHEFARKVMEPMVAGVFMGDSRALSVEAAFPKLVEMERRFGSVLRGALAARRGREPGRRLFSWREGIATLPRMLARRLAGRITTGVAVSTIRRVPGGFAVTTARDGTLRCRAVVLAVQPHVAAALLEAADPQGAEALSGVASPPVAVVFLGYRRAQVDHPLDGLGYLTTRAEGQIISGVQFQSTMFEGRAPHGHVALSCYVGGARNPALARLPASELARAVHRELAQTLSIAGEPAVARVRHWPLGLPQYDLGHVARRAVIEQAHLRLPGLFLTGNYLDGVSVTNCLERARGVALNVLQGLEAQETGIRARNGVSWASGAGRVPG